MNKLVKNDSLEILANNILQTKLIKFEANFTINLSEYQTAVGNYGVVFTFDSGKSYILDSGALEKNPFNTGNNGQTAFVIIPVDGATLGTLIKIETFVDGIQASDITIKDIQVSCVKKTNSINNNLSFISFHYSIVKLPS